MEFVLALPQGLGKRSDSRTNRDLAGKGAVLELVADRLSQSLQTADLEGPEAFKSTKRFL